MGAHVTGPVRSVQGDELLFADEHSRVRRIWLGEDGGTVICKEPRGPDAARRLRTETRVLTRLAGVPGVSRLAGPAWPGALVLADDHAVPLATAIRERPLDLPLFGLRLATTLAAVHARGVVHRDISPANILVYGADRHPLLVDFDRATTFTDDRPGLTHHREIQGTLPCLAPEQTGRSGHPVDHRSDLYAVGAVRYELAYGQPPFGAGGGDELRLLHDILPQTPPHLDDGSGSGGGGGLPVAYWDIVERLLEKEPRRRYQSAEGLAHDLALLRRAPRGGSPWATRTSRPDCRPRPA